MMLSTEPYMTNQVAFSDIPMNATSAPPTDEEGEEMPSFNEMSIVKAAILFVMFLISFVGNLIVLVQLLTSRNRTGIQKSTVQLLITHLAFADILVSLFCNVPDATWALTIQWLAGNATCKLIKCVQLFSVYLSTYITVVIALDRCLAILDPLGRNGSEKRANIMIGVSYTLSAVLSLPQLFIFRVERGPFKEDFYQCVTHGFYTAKWQEQIYSIVSLCLLYLVPLLAMLTSYTLIVCVVGRKSRNLRVDLTNEFENQGRHVRLQLFQTATVRSMRLAAMVVAAFVICWTPYVVVFVVHTFVDTTAIESKYIIWIFFFGMANSMINPLIYGLSYFCGRNRRRRLLKKPDVVKVPWRTDNVLTCVPCMLARHNTHRLQQSRTKLTVYKFHNNRQPDPDRLGHDKQQFN